MSNVATAVGTEAEEDDPPRRRRLLLVLAGLTLLLVLAGVAWSLSSDAAEPADVDGEIVELEPLTTTLGGQGLQHARVSLALVLTVDASPEDVDGRTALLRDALLRELSALDATSVRSAEGSDQLRERLTADAREIFGQEVVRRVVLTELLVQ